MQTGDTLKRGIGNMKEGEGEGGRAYLGLDVDCKRGTASGKAHDGGRQRPGEVDEALLLDSHVAGCPTGTRMRDGGGGIVMECAISLLCPPGGVAENWRQLMGYTT